MVAARVYSSMDALTITAFPISDGVGYVVRVGDHDHEGVYLGAVFHEDGRWVAYTPAGPDGRSDPFGSSADLDDLMAECFVNQMMISDESES